MIVFINWLRALAAILITNSHYDGIYPVEIIANGGLIGDVLFFAVSGFCLCNIKLRFDKWYLKRIVRIYPAVWIITFVYILLGLYIPDSMSVSEIINWFIYPTNYHFVASIMVLYIPFYILMSFNKMRKNIILVMVATLVLWIMVYIFVYDKSIYHIDTVREPMIRFLYFVSMLMGAGFRIYKEKIQNNNRIINWILMSFVFCVYFVSKLAFSKIGAISAYQIINQFAILVLLYYIFRCFIGIDSKLEKMPRAIKNVINYLSKTTLEIYLVQYGILLPIKSLGFAFPANWIVMTGVILLLSFLLHICVKGVNRLLDKGINKYVS